MFETDVLSIHTAQKKYVWKKLNFFLQNMVGSKKDPDPK